jgi:hypothetical protein
MSTESENTGVKPKGLLSNFARLAAVVVFLGLLAVVASIVDIGNNLASIHAVFAWLFYLGLGAGVFWFGVRPLMAIIRRQTQDWTPLLNPDSKPDSEWLQKKSGILLKNAVLSDEERRKLEYHVTFKKDLESCLRELINRKADTMDDIIMTKARMAFLAVAVSQNGPMDALLILSINIAMVKKVVDELGIRPSITDLGRIYFLVAIGAVVIDQFEDLEFGEAIPAMGSMVGKSVVQGMGAALLTLRAGYLAKAYLMKGTDESHRGEARKWARLKLRNVVMTGMGELPRGIARKFESFIPNIDFARLMRMPGTPPTTPNS